MNTVVGNLAEPWKGFHLPSFSRFPFCYWCCSLKVTSLAGCLHSKWKRASGERQLALRVALCARIALFHRTSTCLQLISPNGHFCIKKKNWGGGGRHKNCYNRVGSLFPCSLQERCFDVHLFPSPCLFSLSNLLLSACIAVSLILGFFH